MRRSPIIMLIFLLQFIPILAFPPSLLSGSFLALALVAVFFLLLGAVALTGRLWALTLSIFCQGMNVIIRLMMLFPNAQADDGSLNLAFIAAMLVGIVLSTWLLFRMDRPDVRKLLLA